MSNNKTITSVEQFISELKKIGSPKDGYTRFFRGHAEVGWDLEPSIYRKEKSGGRERIIAEHKIIKDVLTECSEYFSPHDTLFDKLVRMQHYDYPTRLLDISYNSLVGLYFSLADSNNNLRNNKNGEVIVFDVPNEEIKHHSSDTVAILLALSLRDENFDLKKYYNYANFYAIIEKTKYLLEQKNDNLINGSVNIISEVSELLNEFSITPKDLVFQQADIIKREKFKEKFNEQDEIIRLLNDVRMDKPYFLPIIDIEDFNKVVCVKPKTNNPRIDRQQGAFFVFGIGDKKTQPAKIDEKWIVGRLKIDKNSKSDMRDELKYFGISHRTLFPELNLQAQHIMGRYIKSS